MQKISRIIFILLFCWLLILSAFFAVKIESSANKLTFVSNEVNTFKISDDFYFVYPNNSEAEYIKNMGAEIFKDEQKIIIMDKDIPGLRDFFQYKIEDIKNEKDIIQVLSSKIGYLVNSLINSNINNLTINLSEKVKINDNNFIKSNGNFIDEKNNKKYNFVSYSFIYNETPYYIMCIDITKEQNLNLLDFLVPEHTK